MECHLFEWMVCCEVHKGIQYWHKALEYMPHREVLHLEYQQK